MLERIQKANDIKDLKPEELPELAQEIRKFLVEKISKTGGHLASNLGVIELTMALHLSFDLTRDRIIWDVGHQSYTHKILTGRKSGFATLRQYGGMSGFPKTQEDPADAFNTGHSSTSISAGLGMAQARELTGDNYYVVSVIGDGALTGGMAYEAMNNASRMKTNFIIVLNDNQMSISENVGGMNQYLNSFRTSDAYLDLKDGVTNSLNRIPVVGERMVKRIRNAKSGIKQLFVPGMFFENMGITYLGPVDGTNIKEIRKVLAEAKRVRGPVLVHVRTIKGEGYLPAERHPARFHGTGPFDIDTGVPLYHQEKAHYTDVFSNVMRKMGEREPKVVAITAAMADGTGLKRFKNLFPERFFDVGIAEEHAVTFATALARSGAKPVFGVYGTFLQRAYDELWHDLCLNDAPATILVFGASIFGTTSETHLSFFDISMLGGLPNMHYLAPACMEEYLSMLSWSLDHREHPVAIRVPGIGLVSRPDLAPAEGDDYGVARYNVVRQGRDVAVLALGDFFELGERVANRLTAEYGIEATLVNPRFATELDREFLDSLAAEHRVVVTLEDGILDGGWGERVACYLACTPLRTRTFGIAKGFPDRYDPNELLAQNGMTAENMAAEAVRLLNE